MKRTIRNERGGIFESRLCPDCRVEVLTEDSPHYLIDHGTYNDLTCRECYIQHISNTPHEKLVRRRIEEHLRKEMTTGELLDIAFDLGIRA